DQRMPKALGRNAGPRRDARAQRLEEFRDRPRGLELPGREVVAAAVAHDAPLRAPRFVLHRFERQRPNDLDERGFVILPEELRLVAQAFRQPRGREELGLPGHRSHPSSGSSGSRSSWITDSMLIAACAMI